MIQNNLLNRSAKLLFPVLIIFSLLVFWRGHQLPGGGFIGGLVAALAFVLKSIPNEGQMPKIFLGANGDRILALGLILSLSAACMPLFIGETFFKGLWLPYFNIPLLGEIHLGTPLLFDSGVYILVTTFCVKTATNFLELE
jgi:multicomponent Na+:H+ antiporter subunit B